jgi:hypothetical protein
VAGVLLEIWMVTILMRGDYRLLWKEGWGGYNSPQGHKRFLLFGYGFLFVQARERESDRSVAALVLPGNIAFFRIGFWMHVGSCGTGDICRLLSLCYSRGLNTCVF